MARPRHCWLLAFVFCSTAAVAVEWDVEPSFSIAETYTDNLRLDPDNLKVDEYVTEILPEIDIGATAERFQLDFHYALQALRYNRRSDLDETLSYADASGTAKLIGNELLVNFSGTINQQVIFPGGRGSVSAVAVGNRGQVGNYSVNPYWQKRFGKTGSIIIGYRYGLVEYADPILVDSKSDGLTVTIAGAPSGSAWNWRIDARDSMIDYDSGSKVDLRRAGGELAWSPGSDTAIFVSAGSSNNEISQFSGNRTTGGAYWNLGLRGRLDRRTTYSVSAGREYYGNSYQFSFIREAGLLMADISYSESTTTNAQQQQDYQALFDYLSSITGTELPTPGADVYVSKRLSAVGILTLSNSRLRLNAFREDRKFQTTQLGGSDDIISVGLTWTWTLLPRTEFSVDTGWQRFELQSDPNTPEDVRLRFRIKRDFKRDLFLNLGAWRGSRGASVPTDEFVENGASIGVGKSF